MRSLYFNNAFSRKPLDEAVAAMKPFLQDEFENPLTESEGAEKVRAVLQQARQSVAALIQAQPHEIFFVSSGTEANNWALKGTCWNKNRKHFVISAVEHFSVYQTAEYLQRQGFDLSIVPVDRQGLLDPRMVAEEIRPYTFLVSIQSASDEIGVIQNLSAIASLKNRFDEVLFHTDSVQYLCYEELDVRRAPFDFVSLSSNAIYGPAGVGALYIREGTRVQPLLHGGMQEEGMRPGLQSIALIAGFSRAAEVNLSKKQEWKQRIGFLQQKMFDALDNLGIFVTGSRLCRLVDNVHVIVDVDGEAMLTLLLEAGIHASSGSTCYQYAQKESHVLHALGIKQDQARGALLFTLGLGQTVEDVHAFVRHFSETLRHLQKLKP